MFAIAQFVISIANSIIQLNGSKHVFFSPQFALTNYKNLILEANILQNYIGFSFINLIVAPTALISICYAKFRLHL